ncbi:MAG: NlpC/P60 family protein [Xanthobacteraceae bacterium]
MGSTLRVIRGIADVKREPATADAESQLLYGEQFVVQDFDGAWAFGHCVHDGFAGYVSSRSLTDKLLEPTHSVSVLWAPVLRGPFLRFKPCDFLSLGSRLTIIGQRDQFYSLSEHEWVYKAHVVEGVWRSPSYIDLAERLVGVPFVWGGRSTFGFDCTGIIQFVLGFAGISAPRDIPDQLRVLGHPIQVPRRGDLFFLERRGDLFHAGLFVSETEVINVGYRFAGTGVQRFDEIHHLYRLSEHANGTLDQYRVHLRRLQSTETI